MKTVTGQESHYDITELFISRTDLRGIIQFANPVFVRVSKYSYQEILSKPHNVIRHPSMPKGVFYLFWEMLKAQKEIGSYVVNRAKDGSYYWVYALAAPITNGYLSVRLKPSSPMFQTLQTEYETLLELEKTQKLTPQASCEHLLERLKALGFLSYSQFMAEALMQEFESRRKSVAQAEILEIQEIQEVLDLGKQLQTISEKIFSSYQQSVWVPLNLEIQAAKLGREAATIAVVSSKYDGIAKDIQEETHTFLNAGKLIQERVSQCQFDLTNALIQKEMVLFFAQESHDPSTNLQQESAYLEEARVRSLKQAKESLVAIDQELSHFRKVYLQMKKQAVALDIVNITGKIEAAKVKQAETINNLLNDLTTFKIVLDESLKKVNDLQDELKFKVHDLQVRIG